MRARAGDVTGTIYLGGEISMSDQLIKMSKPKLIEMIKALRSELDTEQKRLAVIEDKFLATSRSEKKAAQSSEKLTQKIRKIQQSLQTVRAIKYAKFEDQGTTLDWQGLPIPNNEVEKEKPEELLLIDYIERICVEAVI